MGTALAISPRNRIFLQIVDEVLEACIVTDNRKFVGNDNRPLPFPIQRQKKVSGLRSQLLTCIDDPNMPLAAYATFSLEKDKYNTDRISVEVMIPDDRNHGSLRKIRARPLIQIDGDSSILPFFDVHEAKDFAGNETRTILPTSHPCIILFPNSDDNIHFVVPLGLAKKATLDKWNSIAQQKRDIMKGHPQNLAEVERDWPEIKHMEHAFFMNQKRYLRWEPQMYIPADKDNRLGNYGFFYGQRVIDASDPQKSVIPPDKNADGSEGFFVAQAFEIMSITRNAIYVIWRGPADKVDPKRGALEFDTYSIDGFAALGLTLFTADPDRVERFAKKLASGKADESNPLFRYLRETSAIEEGASGYAIRQAMQRTAKAAAEQVRREFDAKYFETEGQLVTAVAPSYEEVLGGKEPADVWYRESCPEGEVDLAADVVARILGEEFVWESFLCMNLRTFLLRQIANRAGVTEAPARPEKKEAYLRKTGYSPIEVEFSPEVMGHDPTMPVATEPETPIVETLGMSSVEIVEVPAMAEPTPSKESKPKRSHKKKVTETSSVQA